MICTLSPSPQAGKPDFFQQRLRDFIYEIRFGASTDVDRLHMHHEMGIPASSPNEIPLCSVPASGEASARSIPFSSPHKISDFAGAP